MTLKIGSRGTDVIALQALLRNRGYAKVTADGDFGPVTDAAVKDFQSHSGLAADGVVTDQLMDILQGAAGPTILGVDVSYWQQNIDWSKVAGANVKFAYIKASEGNGRKEPMCASQARGAAAAGLKVGYYHFAAMNDPNVVNDADQEAVLFDSVMKSLPKADLMPVLDIETNKSNLSPDLVQRWISEFAAKMTQLGHKLMIYTYTPFVEQYFPQNHPFGELPLWLAQYRNVAYPSMPHGWKSYAVWQYSSTGAIPGIAGNVDLNKCIELPLIAPPSV
jgi:GH25 family lysozyme M1 (1,4-beta-N-acetylmuramidase)